MMHVGDNFGAPGLGTLTVLKELGAGAQGTVFSVQDSAGEVFAFKRYHPATNPGESELLRSCMQRITALARRPSPSPRLAWPIRVVDLPGTFGYLMDLVPPEFKGFNAFVYDRIRPRPRDSVLVTAALEIAGCFRLLHLEGLVYQDLNSGGPRVDPTTGAVQICDLDNVVQSGSPGGVLTVTTAAPEVLRGEAPLSNRTDDHSLAVLLFLLFVRNHPLDGAQEARCHSLNDAAQRKLYGTAPVFIFDPADTSNAPVPGVHDAALRCWPRLPAPLREIFEQAFGPGLRHPEERPTDGQWIRTLSRVRDALFRCRRCAEEAAYDRARRVGREMECYWCSKPTDLPPRLRVGEHIVVLEMGKQLFGHHFWSNGGFDQPLGEVVMNPKNPQRWGLRNLGPTPWRYRKGEAWVSLPPQRAVTLKDGQEIDFGEQLGLIRW